MGDPLPARSRKPALPLGVLPHRVFFKDASKPPRRKKKQRREFVGNWKLFVSPLADSNLSGLAKEDCHLFSAQSENAIHATRRLKFRFVQPPRWQSPSPIVAISVELAGPAYTQRYIGISGIKI